MKILYILLFILFLSILVVVHELGHFTAAKIFKVYCQEFSIGFGPALFHKKRKNGETYFSIRAIPFGGYVSMYGSDEPLEEGTNVPIERSLKGISKWKRAIIMAAGIFMNFILAIVMFFASAQFFPEKKIYVDQVESVNDSIAYKAGILTNDIISYLTLDKEYLKKEDKDKTLYYFDNEGLAYYKNDEGNETSQSNISVCLLLSGVTFSRLNFDRYLKAYVISSSSDGTAHNYYDVLDNEALIKIEFNISTYVFDEDGNPIFETDEEGNIVYQKDEKGNIVYQKDEEGNKIPIPIQKTNKHNIILNKISEEKDNKTIYKFEPLGLSFKLYSHRNSFSEAFVKTFKNFGEGSTLIFRSLGDLIIGKGWDQVGGPIAIYQQSTLMLIENGFGYFLYLWALISVNLAIFNLLPFPGLDGWHLLVLAIEAIFKKEVPEKAKNIVSFVGMILLFALMGLVLIKDILGLF